MFDLRVARWARLMALGALFVPALATAQLRPVAPGETPQLAANEALLVVAVDSDVPLAGARLKHGDGYFDLSAVEAGTSYALYIAEAGRYSWRDVVEADAGTRPLDAATFSFDLTAGELNYAGDIVVRSQVEGPEAVVLTNRSLKAMDWMSRAFPRIKKKRLFRYAGNVPDGFPAYYGAIAATAPGKSRPALAARDFPVAVETMFQPTGVTLARMNPSGTQVALKRRNGAGEWRIDLIDLRRGGSLTLERDADEVAGMEWSADDTLLTTRGEAGQAQQVTLARIGEHGVRERIALPVAGVVIDTLPADDGHLLLATAQDDRWMVHKVDVSSPAAARAFRPHWRTRLNRGGGDEVAWYADTRGELRLAMALREEGYVLTRGGGDAMASVADTGFQPVGASSDASVLYGVTDRQRAQRELVAFDAASKTTRTLFARPGVDVEAPIFDAARQPIGVTYYERGRLVSEYFAQADRAIDAKLRARFPTQSVAVLDRSADGRRLLLSVEGADEAPSLWRFDADGQAARLAIGIEALEGVALAPTRSIAVRAKDGLAVEALLTVPKGEGRKPLVVMPHGGPIAVADRLHFNRETQFLASLGYAVLRVNFRGSDGYGRAFREAGHGQYGRGIEDDIDAAIEQVGEQVAEVDTGRMCMLGASYGGYSALVSAARWPQRFRCAVSISGISDLSLMFSASDAGRSEEGRRLLTQLIGDPVAQAAALREASPAYYADRIRVPVMLVHGRDDTRVDPEHFERMQRVLERHGNPPLAMMFEGEGHGIEQPRNVRAMWEGIAGFLAQNL